MLFRSDLVVHRLLKQRIANSSAKKRSDDGTLLATLDDISMTSSNCERTSTEIERAVDSLYAAWFMKDRIGESFDGVVQGVAEFGLFVNLVGAHVEGLVRVTDLGGDFFVYDDVRLQLRGERSGQTFTIGDQVEVKIAAVDVSKRQIALVLEGVEPQASQRDRGRGQGRGRGSEREPRGGGRGPKPTGKPQRGKRDDRRPPARTGKPSAPPTAAKRPSAPEELRKQIRGPEDLRRIFEEKQGRSGKGKKKPRR